MTADTMISSTMISSCCLRDFSMTYLLSKFSCCVLRERGEVLPARERGGDLLDRNIGRHLGDDGIDLVVGFQRPAARDLAPLGRRRELELQLLRVVQGDVADGIAGRREFVAHQADDGELVTVRAQRHFLAERKAGGAVDDHFVMAADNVAPGESLRGPPGRPSS